MRTSLYPTLIIEDIDKIIRVMQSGETTFLNDATLQDATCHRLVCIREAARHLPWALRNNNPSFPWNELESFRMLVARYWEFTPEKVWTLLHAHYDMLLQLRALADKYVKDTHSRNGDEIAKAREKVAVSPSPARKHTTPMTITTLASYRDQILELTEQHKALNIKVFGSVARGEATSRSDINFLVDTKDGQSLIDFIRLQHELEALLGYDVQLAVRPVSA